MILPSEDKEEEAMPLVPIIKEPTQVAPEAQPISTTVEEEEDLVVPAEELDKYFLSPLASLVSSLISKLLEVVHEHLLF